LTGGAKCPVFLIKIFMLFLFWKALVLLDKSYFLKATFRIHV
jgi:hypothetical protein